MNPRTGRRGSWKLKGAFNIQELPPVLVVDILSRLSIKTLYSCRSVCKDWLRIIHGSEFAQLHLRRSPISILVKTFPKIRANRKLDLIQIAGSRMRVERMRFSDDNNVLPVWPVYMVELINSCNGLLCIRKVTDYDSLHVCNPILGEYIRIAFPDRSTCTDFIALGFSTRTNEYKILHTHYCSNYGTYDLIYTIGTGVWRRIGKRPSRSRVGRIPFNSFLHGALHWFPCHNPHQGIECFDFEREEFRQLLLPFGFKRYDGASYYKRYDGLRLGVLKDCLFLCVFEGDDGKSDVWLMKNYGVQESWTKVLVIEVREHLHPKTIYRDMRYAYEPILFLSDVEMLIMSCDRLVVRYNLVTKCVERTRIVQTESQFQACDYYPCFVSLHDVANGEEVKRIRDSEKFGSLLSEGSNDCTGSTVPPDYKTCEA
ncbi:F-box protein At3g07870 [Argentina anserina]|uniref:F-box protein At3g07870 n=1 Tax=Argentina anserina TaxID=57926 RepID=UPI002176279E|nr:F-box protein At3g07870 [Potentilla anserina]